MDLSKLNDLHPAIVGGVGALIFIITGLLSRGLFEVFIRLTQGHPIVLYDPNVSMLNNASPYLFAFLITGLLITVFGGVFTVVYESYKQQLRFKESGKTWEEWTYKST
jgi:hypothetical protein